MPGNPTALIVLCTVQSLLAAARLLFILTLPRATGAPRTGDVIDMIPLFPDALISLVTLFVANNAATQRAKGRFYPERFFPGAITTMLLPGVVFVVGMTVLELK